MNRRWQFIAIVCLGFESSVPAADEPAYVKKATKVETVLATLRAAGLPTLQGKWHYAGPFDNENGTGFDAVYLPEKGVDLTRKYDGGKDGVKIAWKEFPDFPIGKVNNLARFDHNDNGCVYLYHEFESPRDLALPVWFGSDDTLTVWLNGDRLVSENVQRSCAPDQNRAVFRVKQGKNKLLVKVCNGGGDWEVYVCPDLPEKMPARVRSQFERDFPVLSRILGSASAAEAIHYRLVKLPVPDDCVMEVGGLAFRPDGKLLACTRRGEVWLISYAESEEPGRTQFQLWASGLHEALGLCVEDNHTIYVVQRPELTKVVDRSGAGRADEFVTVCDKWGVSGDYHEFAFGPARDKYGNFFVTLNVGFSGGHQSKAPWRGWCVKISPDGHLTPWATGLRSPNGVNFSPDGDLFYADNQGEWVATCALHHVRRGDFYGHPAGLRWLKDSSFAGKWPEVPASGMTYDGQKGQNGISGMPNLNPPSVWFPYGRMGQSVSEPCWDTTSGKFGPFAGQMFIGDQTKLMVMRVALEKINGTYQGACFPFRSGFQCGINRLAFGPDGSLYAGETNRGWGSLGGKPYGLERLVYTGVLPFEVLTMKLTRTGFDLTFTKPLEPAAVEQVESYGLKSFTHYYWSTYGSPEVDPRSEKVSAVKLSDDRRTVSLAAAGLKPGRVYELHLDGVKSADGEALLHPEAYYTLNELP